MKRFFPSLFGQIRTSNKRSWPDRNVRLALERLEGRDLLALLISPHFEGVQVAQLDLTGKETSVHAQHRESYYIGQRYAPKVALTSPDVYILFANNAVWDWNDHLVERNTVTTAAADIINGPYLNGLDQYGYIKKSFGVGGATVANAREEAWVSPQAPLSTVTSDAVMDDQLIKYIFLGTNGQLGEIYKHGYQATKHSDRDMPIFVVVTAPGTSLYQGKHEYDTIAKLDNKGAVVWVETTAGPYTQFKDDFTANFSRGIANAVAHNLLIDLPPREEALYPDVPVNRAKLTDGEAAAYTSVRAVFPGYSLTPYWSARDQAYIIPNGDGNILAKSNWSQDDKTFLGLDYPTRFNPVTNSLEFAQGVDKITALTRLPAVPALQDDNITFFNNLWYKSKIELVHAESCLGNDCDMPYVVIGVSANNQDYAYTDGLRSDLSPDFEFGLGSPSLAVFNNQLYIAWTGQKDNRVKVAVVEVDAQGAPTGELNGKNVIQAYVSDHGPALEAYQDALFLSFAGIDNDNTLWLDCMNLTDQNWGHRLTSTGVSADTQPQLAVVEDRLILKWTDLDDNPNNLARVNTKTVDIGAKILFAVGGPVSGDPASGNVNVTLGLNDAGGVRYTQNGVVQDYAPGALNTVYVETGPGTNTVSILAIPAGTAVTIFAHGRTTMTVGNLRSMANVQGDLNVWGDYQSVDLTLDDSNYRQGQNIEVSSKDGLQAVTGMSGGSTIRFGQNDLSKLTLQTSKYGAQNVVQIYDTPNTSEFTELNLNGFSGKLNSVYVYGTTGALKVIGNAAQVNAAVYPAGFDNERPSSKATIQGPVDFSNTVGWTILTVNCRNDAIDHPNVSLEQERLTGLSPVAITWQRGNLLVPGVTSLGVLGGDGNSTYNVVSTGFLRDGPVDLEILGNGNNTINVENTLGPLDVHLGGGSDTVNISPGARRLETIQGAVTVTGGGGKGKLWYHDQASVAGNTYVVSETAVSRVGMAPVIFSALKEVHVGGEGSDVYRVLDTAAATSTYVTTNDTMGNQDSLGNRVIVEGTRATSGLYVTGATGRTLVTVGLGKVLGINGNILVDATGGQVSLEVNNGADMSAHSALLSHRWVGSLMNVDVDRITRLAVGAISYYGDRVTPTIQLGSGSLSILDTGLQRTTVNTAAANVNVSGTTGPVQINAIANRVVTAGDGSLQRILGAINVNSLDRSAQLVVAGANDSGRTGTLAAGVSDVLSGLSPAAISYASGQVRPTIKLGPGSSLTVAGTRGLDLLGQVAVTGRGTNVSLTIDDRNGTGVPADLPLDATNVQTSLEYSVTGQDVTRTAGFGYSTPTGGGGGVFLTTISYQGITTLELDGSNLGAVYTVEGTAPATPITIRGGTGNDTVSVQAAQSRISVFGNDGRDTITNASGVRQTTVLDGGAGDDTITGGGGIDFITGGPGDDLLNGGLGFDRLVESADVNFTLTDTSLGGLGNDVLLGVELAALMGGNGNNSFNVSGWTGTATLAGTAGLDTVTCAGDADFSLSNTLLTRSTGGRYTLSAVEQAVLTGGARDNVLNASLFTLGGVTLDGAGGNDGLTGGSRDDVLLGGEGNDTVTGGGGRDFLIGGPGDDLLRGGVGDDVLINGTTRYDVFGLALASVLAEWRRTDRNYDQRVDHLRNGGPGDESLNGSNLLNAATVIDDQSADTLAGDADQDWFFAPQSGDTLTDRVAATEQVN